MTHNAETNISGLQTRGYKAISKMSVVPWSVSNWVCSSLFRYVSSFTIPLRLRPDVAVVAELNTL